MEGQIRQTRIHNVSIGLNCEVNEFNSGHMIKSEHLNKLTVVQSADNYSTYEN